MTDSTAPISRVSVPELEAMLGTRLTVLDDGFVRVVDYMGGDESVVQAARVSYGNGTKRVSEDRGLIRYLMRNRHTTPFEMCEIKLHVRIPMDTWRQWIRHRTASVNEYSTRYSLAIDVAQRTDASQWRTQSTANRQGSGGLLDGEVGQRLSAEEAELQAFARRVYEDRIAAGVAREQARKDLPLSTYTEAYWKIDLHNLFHFLALRMDSHAQAEIRAYADVIGNVITKAWCPLSWEAFADYRLKSMALTSLDVALIQALQVSASRAIEVAKEAGILGPDGTPVGVHRERDEVERRLEALGFNVPWRTPHETDSK